MFQDRLLLPFHHFMEELLSLTKVKYLVQGHLDNTMQLCSNPSWRKSGGGEVRNGQGWVGIFPSYCALSPHEFLVIMSCHWSRISFFLCVFYDALIQANAISLPDACNNS